MITLGRVEERLHRLFDVTKRFAAAVESAGIPYRLIGGFAVFLHVDLVDPIAARLTPDVDVAIDRGDLGRIVDATTVQGFAYDHAAEMNTLIDVLDSSARSVIHLIFVREKVRRNYLEPTPDFSEPRRSAEGILLAPVADLVRMKLISYRLIDQVHIQDMDSVGLITPEIEAGLSEPLRARLAEVRATE